MTLSVYDREMERAKREGAEETFINIAISLLADDMSVEKVMQHTGLSEEKVRELQAQMKSGE